MVVGGGGGGAGGDYNAFNGTGDTRVAVVFVIMAEKHSNQNCLFQTNPLLALLSFALDCTDLTRFE